MAREEAIARVRNLPKADRSAVGLFRSVFARAELLVAQWRSGHPLQQAKLTDLQHDLRLLRHRLATDRLDGAWPWNELFLWAEDALSEEGQELLASLLLEPYGEMIDGLAHCMADTNANAFRINGRMAVGEVRTLIEQSFGWALNIDWQARPNCARAWYVSEEKLEPRLGERFEEPVADYEQPLAPARDAAAAYADLASWPDDAVIADVLLRHPEHRHTVRRAQMSRFAPYGEIRDNTIGDAVRPIDMLRAKLSFFGATHFDPRSDRWVRICMYAGAPYPEELSVERAEDWVYPELPA